MSLWETIGADIEAATGQRARLRQQESVGGGCINQAVRVEYGDSSYLVKLSGAGQLEMFAAEALGLQELQQCSELRIPEPVCWGDDGRSSWLVMEYLDLGGRGDAVALAAGLASMHRITRPVYGWVRDNTIGSTPQINTPADDWIEFWRDRRLRFQLELAARNGAGSNLQAAGERLLDESLTGLSGGEIRRIALARAFLRDAPLVILDEATASLDPESEREVLAAIETLAAGRTLLIIAHRLHTIRRADHILVLDRGRLEEAGVHDVLMGRDGLYRRLVSGMETPA